MKLIKIIDGLSNFKDTICNSTIQKNLYLLRSSIRIVRLRNVVLSRYELVAHIEDIPNNRILFVHAAAISPPLRRIRLVSLCFFLSSLNSIVIYVSVSSRADVAFSARRSRSSLKEYLSCLFLRASSREAVNTYGRSRVLEGPRGWWRRREPPQRNMVRVS